MPPTRPASHPAAPPREPEFGKPPRGWRERLYTIIFEADTPAGLAFDLTLIGAILASILVVMLDSVQHVHEQYGPILHALEWFFTILFTAEYLVRLTCVQHPVRYATSFFGIIDLLAVVPTYISLLVPGAGAFLDVRTLRLIRVFRVLKLTLYLHEYQLVVRALRASGRKIFVFLTMVLMAVLLLGTLMYVVEGPENGFTSIPMAMYWGVISLTTVGYGDIVPQTGFGRLIASLVVLLGWGTLAVPTGIFTAEMISGRQIPGLPTTRTCPACLSEGHEASAHFCKDCGAELPPYRNE